MLAAGTAAALVPIRSITRRLAATDAKSLAADASTRTHGRVTLGADGKSETITYIADDVDEPGTACTRLLGQLKAIQLGKVKDEFGGCFAVTEEDGRKVLGEQA